MEYVLRNSDTVPVLRKNLNFFRHRVGLRVVGKPSLRAFTACAMKLGRDYNGHQWAIGDLFAYGELRGDWGETYIQAADFTKFAEQTLQNWIWVCKRFEISRRKENLSFTHHSVIAGIDYDPREKRKLIDHEVKAIQDKLLDLAEANRWSSRILAEVARPYKTSRIKAAEESIDETDSELENMPPALVYDGPLDDAAKWLDNTLADKPHAARVKIELFVIVPEMSRDMQDALRVRVPEKAESELA